MLGHWARCRWMKQEAISLVGRWVVQKGEFAPSTRFRKYQSKHVQVSAFVDRHLHPQLSSGPNGANRNRRPRRIRAASAPLKNDLCHQGHCKTLPGATSSTVSFFARLPETSFQVLWLLTHWLRKLLGCCTPPSAASSCLTDFLFWLTPSLCFESGRWCVVVWWGRVCVSRGNFTAGQKEKPIGRNLGNLETKWTTWRRPRAGRTSHKLGNQLSDTIDTTLGALRLLLLLPTLHFPCGRVWLPPGVVAVLLCSSN